MQLCKVTWGPIPNLNRSTWLSRLLAIASRAKHHQHDNMGLVWPTANPTKDHIDYRLLDCILSIAVSSKTTLQ